MEWTNELTPAAIVAELDRYIVGQREAKRAVAIALRNRLRRARLPAGLRDDVTPANILMIGPTGVGKTEIARRVARIIDAPFVKVEATRFTEAGYVGHDVESIVRELVEASIVRLHGDRLAELEPATARATSPRQRAALPGHDHSHSQHGGSPASNQRARRESPVPALAAKESSDNVRRLSPVHQRLLARVAERALDDDPATADAVLVEAAAGGRLTAGEARRLLAGEDAAPRRDFDLDGVLDAAIRDVEERGVVFLDEIDKLVSPGGEFGAGVSSEGVQRDLLPIVEGTTVLTRYGPVHTDRILFIAAGVFNDVKPADLIPELQGRFPLRVELAPLEEDDLYAILVEPANALARQQAALLATEGVTLDFAEDGLREIAAVAAILNERQEDLGARRLATIVEQVLEEVSFDAPDHRGETVVIDAAYVRERIGDIAADEDLSNFIL